jgi:hypothetical protein
MVMEIVQNQASDDSRNAPLSKNYKVQNSESGIPCPKALN